MIQIVNLCKPSAYYLVDGDQILTSQKKVNEFIKCLPNRATVKKIEVYYCKGERREYVRNIQVKGLKSGRYTIS